MEGGSRSSRTRGGMRWTRQRRARKWNCRAGLPVSDRPARGRTTLLPVFAKLCRTHEVQRSPWRGRSRTAKSCGPDAPMLASSFAEMHPPNRAGCIEDLRSDGGKKAGHRGEREASRNPSRRESRFDPVEPVVISCASCAHDRGCNRHPAFPAPSAFLGGRFRSKSRALRAAGRRTHILWMHI
jgi:hypothetical protein